MKIKIKCWKCHILTLLICEMVNPDKRHRRCDEVNKHDKLKPVQGYHWVSFNYNRC
jgi:hypothetical protein